MEPASLTGAPSPPHLVRRFGLLQSTALNMSNMIGIGPFITVPALMSTMGGGPQAMLGWLLAVLIVIPDGMVWSELGAAMPGSGGSYIYLREGFGRESWGRLAAFLFIWQFILSGPLEIASGYIGFTQYAAYIFPGVNQTIIGPVTVGAFVTIGVGLLNVFLLYRKITTIARITVSLWIGVMLTVAAVILTGVQHFEAKRAFDFPPHAFDFSIGFVFGMGAAARIGIYDYLGYYDVCYIGDEVKNPGKVIPRSIILSIVGVALIYFSINLSIIGVVPWREFVPAENHANANFIASLFMEKVYGSKIASLFTIMVLWTAFGSCFALLLGYSRIPYAAAQDGYFFRVFGRLHPRKGFPHVSLIVIGLISILFSFGPLITVIDALLTTRVLIQFIGQILAVALLRKRNPNGPRPYRMWLYPLPSLIALAGWIFVFGTAPWKQVAFGLGSLVLGIALFVIWGSIHQTLAIRDGRPPRRSLSQLIPMKATAPILLLALALASRVLADGPADNQTNQVRRIPPPGVMIAETDRAELQSGLDQLGKQIQSFRERFPTNSSTRRYLPDVQIFDNAVRYALRYDEFYNPTNEVSSAKALLQEGLERIASLEKNQAPWSTATGLVVRGYLSKIDGSVQPLGLVVPSGFRTGSADQFRLDAWFHGRDEKLTELNFLTARQKSAGEFQPPQAFVLHLYGRYCNANKFAGEVDLFEALDRVRQEYPIDQNRIVVRGFSMGGAACWQFATHFAGLWAAAAPGAGFAETADFLKVFQSEAVQPTSYEQKLWHWYDSTDYAVNLFNCPTVAYSGEIDKQRQAADKMAQALQAEGIELAQIIGPQTGHRYHPDSKVELNRRIDSIVAHGRNPVPRKVRFTTWTLRYNQMLWVTVDGLGQHWERARVDAELVDDHTLKATTENVTALTFSIAAGLCPLDISRKPTIVLDGVEMEGPAVLSDRSWTAHFQRDGSSWRIAPPTDEGLRKVHGLQGPIDDAFMDSFIMVHPTGRPLNGTIAAWTSAEETHAIEHWRRQFRGEPRIKNDSDITDEDIAANHLILWGDPASNSLLQKISAQLPVRWDQNGVRAGDATFPADHYAPVLIYPNPLNPKRYIVLNSGFTFRDYDYLNNARQVAKLPDYAIIDLSIPPSSRLPGGIAKAGFFDENWRLDPK